jgi:hypothetical protein
MYLQGSNGISSECPKCKFSMEALRDSAVLNAEEGFILDSRGYSDVDDNAITSYLFGSISRFLWRYLIEPLSYKLFGDWKSRRYRKLLAEYPRSLICTHCRYVVKRR